MTKLHGGTTLTTYLHTLVETPPTYTPSPHLPKFSTTKLDDVTTLTKYSQTLVKTLPISTATPL
jgi:hypothetical protein